MNFAQTRSVIENLMTISEITMYGKGNIQGYNNSVFDFKEVVKTCQTILLFCLMKLN